MGFAQRRKPILSLDFDGVVHSYKSGWSGAKNINDEPVEGALDFIIKATKHFDVAIFSSRSHQWGGRRAMKKWLREWFVKEAQNESSEAFKFVAGSAFADPWDDEVEWASRKFLKTINFPFFKPPAMISIDDRALTFTGFWPDVESLLSFKPWNRKKLP